MESSFFVKARCGTMSINESIFAEAKAWPFDEARKLLRKYSSKPPEKGFVLFETGYGPSGLPHIGTFGEVMRTSMVKTAFERLSDIPTKLVCFSDDMDGLRKIPSNIPNGQTLMEDLNLPLTSVRDPFGISKSFADHNNSKLREFLDRFSFDYEFISATNHYKSGKFDEILLRVLDNYSKIMEIMLPSLGNDRKASYSPFMPISKKNGHVLQVPTLDYDSARGTIIYEDQGERVETEVTGGKVKLQWKPDWAMRWCALEVDYEMHGKDLIPSADLGRKICNALGFKSPELFSYELFLDDDGKKISKSKGNGLTINEWLEYAEPNSLSLFMYQKPKTAKRLFFDVIPKAVDEYHQHLNSFVRQDEAAKVNNPVWHIHAGKPPLSDLLISFSMLLNLASACGAQDKKTLWGFISKYVSDATPESHPGLDLAAEYAVRYFNDFVKPKKIYRLASKDEATALTDLSLRLSSYKGALEAEELQKIVYAVGKEHSFDPLKDWFIAIYEILLGSSQGPRFGGFIALYGIKKTTELISLAVSGRLANR